MLYVVSFLSYIPMHNLEAAFFSAEFRLFQTEQRNKNFQKYYENLHIPDTLDIKRPFHINRLKFIWKKRDQCEPGQELVPAPSTWLWILYAISLCFICITIALLEMSVRETNMYDYAAHNPRLTTKIGCIYMSSPALVKFF